MLSLIRMCVLQMSDRDLTPAQVEDEKTKLKAYVARMKEEGIALQHLLVQVDNSAVGRLRLGTAFPDADHDDCV